MGSLDLLTFAKYPDLPNAAPGGDSVSNGSNSTHLSNGRKRRKNGVPAKKKKEGKKWKQTKEEEEEGKKRKPVKNFFVIELKFHWIKCQLPAAAFVFG